MNRQNLTYLTFFLLLWGVFAIPGNAASYPVLEIENLENNSLVAESFNVSVLGFSTTPVSLTIDLVENQEVDNLFFATADYFLHSSILIDLSAVEVNTTANYLLIFTLQDQQSRQIVKERSIIIDNQKPTLLSIDYNTKVVSESENLIVDYRFYDLNFAFVEVRIDNLVVEIINQPEGFIELSAEDFPEVQNLVTQHTLTLTVLDLAGNKLILNERITLQLTALAPLIAPDTKEIVQTVAIIVAVNVFLFVVIALVVKFYLPQRRLT